MSFRRGDSLVSRGRVVYKKIGVFKSRINTVYQGMNSFDISSFGCLSSMCKLCNDYTYYTRTTQLGKDKNYYVQTLKSTTLLQSCLSSSHLNNLKKM